MNGPHYTEDTEKAPVRTLLDVMITHGVEEIVCSPGSRNTPLLIAASVRQGLKKTIVADERSAAFIALGKSIASGKPVALVCTSGTAMLNYAPAIAEAYHQGVPLIAITADRPMEWIDQDDSQTIRQQDTFQNYIKAGYDIISGRDDADYLWFVNRIANEGMLRSLDGKQGPVHFNIRLSSPLGNTITLPSCPDNGCRVINMEKACLLPKKVIDDLANAAAGKKILVVAGFHKPDSKLNKAIRTLSENPDVFVWAETLSNLHLSPHQYAIDTTISQWDSEAKSRFRPDILISLGGALVSRMLKEWLRLNPPQEHWSIGYGDTAVDCFKSLTLRLSAKESNLISSLAGALKKKSAGLSSESYREIMTAETKRWLEHGMKKAKNAEWSDLAAYRDVFESLPEKCNLYLSNGTSVRYAQLFSRNLPHAEYCNRGVSGIDGSSSTAIGGATMYKGMTVLITGDMSFAYDLGALGSRLADGRMRIIVVNNNGGGIFRFIGSTSRLPQREEYFCADPEVPVEGLATAYGWSYNKAGSSAELKELLPGFFDPAGCSPDSPPRIMEIITPPQKSAEILKGFLNIK